MPRTEGEIITLTNRDEIIARFSTKMEVGTSVIDNTNKKVGTINDIFGPVKDPYYQIESTKKREKRISMLGKKLYVEEEYL